jgi:hypothetical protein
MFDPDSSQLLQSAPSLPGIEAADLPRLLTEIYTELVTDRVRGVSGDNAVAAVIRLTEIANSYEMIAVTNTDTAHARAAAFVAGSAYQILAKSIPAVPAGEDNILSRDHISGDLAAALLFLIAQQLPDAREAIRGFSGIGQEEPFEIRMLAASLIDLVRENFNGILNRAAERAQTATPELPPVRQATIHLYEQVLQGIELLAAAILGLSRPGSVDRAANTPGGIFQQVLDLSVREFTIDGLPGSYISTYPGPAHLAHLLLQLGQTMLDASILLLPPPAGTDADIWQAWLNYRAAQKPLLWRNHRTAIGQGFHLLGNSAVLVLPTGAGKTTIAEFKIAATLAAGLQVLFLAPTNALVEQLLQDLAISVPADIFDMDDTYDADLFTAVKGTLPDLSVMTPEKCLAVLNFNPEAFETIGLVIFDECHSLSAEAGSFRRALDGMLVILRLAGLLPQVDLLLLSAMIQAPSDLADWVSQLTGKPCIPVDLVWKPSRQARGVIIYKRAEIAAAQSAATVLQRQLDRAAVANKRQPSDDVRAAPGRLLQAVPHALFGLVNNWHPDAPEDIRIRQLAEGVYPLNGQLTAARQVVATPNGNEISRRLSVAAAQAGLKTIVFMNNTLWANKSAKETAALVTAQVTYNGHEAKLFAAVETEFGKPECSMMHGLTRCVQHHADLIGLERQLAESLFKREDGARIIFATTTLSQGMNLPAQVAILSADERAALGGEYITQEPMKAHELLNAAGRAGRAGYLANGLVIMVPRTLLSFTEEGPEAAAHTALQSIIPEDERCVPVVDPLGLVLDRIQMGLPPNADIEYLFHRLGNDADGDSVKNLLGRSFAHYAAQKAGELQAFDAAVAAFSDQLAQSETVVDAPGWLLQLSIQSGISPLILNRLLESVGAQFGQLPATVESWVGWLIDWLAHHDDAGKFCFGADLLPLQTIGSMRTVTPQNYEAILMILKTGMMAWLNGEPLMKVEEAMGGTLRLQKIFCPKARELATNTAPRCLSYFSTFIVQIVKIIAEGKGEALAHLAVLECLPGAISKGAESPQKLAFMQLTRTKYRSRVEAHADYRQRFKRLGMPDFIDYQTVIQLMGDKIG